MLVGGRALAGLAAAAGCFRRAALELTEIAESILCGVAAGLRMRPARCDQAQADLDFGVVGQLFRTAGVAAPEGMTR
jgi:hypothetical protein